MALTGQWMATMCSACTDCASHLSSLSGQCSHDPCTWRRQVGTRRAGGRRGHGSGGGEGGGGKEGRGKVKVRRESSQEMDYRTLPQLPCSLNTLPTHLPTH